METNEAWMALAGLAAVGATLVLSGRFLWIMWRERHDHDPDEPWP